MDSNRETGKLQGQMQEPKAMGAQAFRSDTEGPSSRCPRGWGGQRVGTDSWCVRSPEP